jgi:D-amino-acid oxidase
MLRTVYLTPPSISDAHIEKKVVCIRSHRERIFCVSSELKNDKLLCHLYGHGGAGWTFLFGSVQKAVQELEHHLTQNPSYKNKPICVVGAGCFGLLSAVTLARLGYEVRIVAKELDNLPSDRAAGFFFPRPRKCSNPEERAIFESVGMASYSAYLEIATGMHPFIKNASKLMPAYYNHEIDPGFGLYREQGLIPSPEKVTIDFGNDKKYDVMEYQTVFINPSEVMSELRRNIQELGISIEIDDVQNLDELPESIVFNCAGKSAPIFNNDTRMVPVQGHLITLKNQPPMDQLQYMINVRVAQLDPNNWSRDTLLYYAPKNSGILGITFIRGQADETANADQFDKLLERARRFFGNK